MEQKPKDSSNVVELFPDQETGWLARLKNALKAPDRMDPLASKREQQEFIAKIRAANQAQQPTEAEIKKLGRVA